MYEWMDGGKGFSTATREDFRPRVAWVVEKPVCYIRTHGQGTNIPLHQPARSVSQAHPYAYVPSVERGKAHEIEFCLGGGDGDGRRRTCVDLEGGVCRERRKRGGFRMILIWRRRQQLAAPFARARGEGGWTRGRDLCCCCMDCLAFCWVSVGGESITAPPPLPSSSSQVTP